MPTLTEQKLEVLTEMGFKAIHNSKAFSAVLQVVIPRSVVDAAADEIELKSAIQMYVQELVDEWQ